MWVKINYSFLERRQWGPKRSVLLLIIGWLVGNAVFSETVLRIFLIFCMKLGDYKGSKVTAGVLKKILDLEIFTKRSPNWSKIRHFDIWPSIWMKLIFQKNLQFGDIWPRNRQKIAQIEVFGHFLKFASLVFLDFAHNDRWA